MFGRFTLGTFQKASRPIEFSPVYHPSFLSRKIAMSTCLWFYMGSVLFFLERFSENFRAVVEIHRVREFITVSQIERVVCYDSAATYTSVALTSCFNWLASAQENTRSPSISFPSLSLSLSPVLP